MRKAVVLLSGGLDSTVCMAIAKQQGFSPCALTVIYGQRHEIEIEAAKRVAKNFAAEDHRFVTISLREIGGSALTDNIAVPKNRNDDEMANEIPVTYVPARNTVFLALAMAYAEVLEAWDIFIGVNAVDFSGYPDCRPEFIEAFENLAQVATKMGVNGAKISIHTPLLRLKKSEIIQRGLALDVDFSETHSCYDPDDLGRACGHCDSCLIRKKAFAEIGQLDPVLHHLEQ